MKRIIYWLSPFCFLLASSTGLAVGPALYLGIDLYALGSTVGTSNAYIGTNMGGNPVAGGRVVGYVGNEEYALIWNPPAGTTVNLQPTNIGPYFGSSAFGTDGVNQVGRAFTASFLPHAMLWHSTANSAVDLHPTRGSFGASVAVGVSGSQQVGSGELSPCCRTHALLWNGTAQSAVDLHPSQFAGISDFSWAKATDGSQQVGQIGRNGQDHAVVWNGTAASAVDLHPNGLANSYAIGVGGGQQVGFTYDAGGAALLWTGTAESVVNLNPTNLPGITSAQASATNGVHQVGGGGGHALLWSGTADSTVDLHEFLPPGFVSSGATSIDATGIVWGLAVDAANQTHAVKWVPVPEPSTALLGAIGLATMMRRLRRRAA